MTDWARIPPETLVRALTPAQLEAVALITAGASQRTAAAMLGISRAALKDRLRSASHRLEHSTHA